MNEKESLIGKNFGYWTIISGPFSGKNREKTFECKCKCGTKKIVRFYDLQNSITKSCGCTKRIKIKIGQKFGYLTVIEEPFIAYSIAKKGRVTFIKLKCICGKEQVGPYTILNRYKSCGCKTNEFISKRNKKHGFSRTRIYSIWKGMTTRCNNPKSSSFKKYGAKNIKICEEWQNIYNFTKWSLENGYKENLTIHRKNPNGNYEPSNCIWISKEENGRRIVSDREDKIKSLTFENANLKLELEIYKILNISIKFMCN